MKERGDLIVENQQPNIKTREEACRWAVMRVRALIADERDLGGQHRQHRRGHL